MIDLHRLGGTPLLLKHLMKAGIIDGGCMTVSGKSMAENLADVRDVPSDQDLIAPHEKPFKPFADMQVCFGNVAPGGVVFKVSSLQQPQFRGRAACFTDARSVAEAVAAKRIKPGTFIVLRYQGPVASGMPEVLVATAALAVPELDGKVAFLSDTRVSGVSHGAIGVHCAPEAAVGGPIALIEDGDEISFDLLRGEITLHIEDREFARRRQAWQPPPANRTRGYLADFCATAAQANFGCVSRALYPDCAE
jgi:dihydroxy-acid dehydratase